MQLGINSRRKFGKFTSVEIETVIIFSPINKSLTPHSFTGEFYQKFLEKQIPILLKNCRGRKTSKLIPRGHHHSDTKNKDMTKKENSSPISLMNIEAKIFNKMLKTEFYNTLKRSHIKIKWFDPRDARILQYMQIIQCDTPY